MNLSLNWVKQYVKLPDVPAKDIALALTMSTVEVEDIIDQARDLEGICVGKIVEIVKHPQADRLWICQVSVKTEELQVICGGNNLSKDMLVAVAKVGSKVRWHGKGELIALAKAKIRGVESNGMIASSVEIGLQRLFPASSDHEILDLTPYNSRVGEPLSKALGLTDTILVIDNKSMTHRPDLWGLYGLARELAAIYNLKLKPMSIPQVPSVSGSTLPLSVTVNDTGLCQRYAAIVLDDIMVGQSPWWLRRDLEALGINSVNAIVDVTNYVMVSLGQPIHAFDYEKVADQKIIVEQAGEGVHFKALNDKEYEVPANTLMIKDGKKSCAIAGITGGANSQITDKTTTIVLEVANFQASSIRRSSMTLGLRTEASARFEKRLDPELVPQALAMAVDLILKASPGSVVVSPVIDEQNIPTRISTVEVPKAFLDARLGVSLDPKLVTSILKRLEFGVSFRKNIFTITIPSFRSRDIMIPEDIVEEVARIYGYGTITPALPRVEIASPQRNIASKVERELRMLLAYGYGWDEVCNYSFAVQPWSDELGLNRNRIAVANPLSSEQSYLRTSLLPGLLSTAVNNARWYNEFKCFELGRVFSKTAGEFARDSAGKEYLPSQPVMIGGIIASKTKTDEELFREAKGVLCEALGRMHIIVSFKESKHYSFCSACLEVRVHDKTIGYLGLLKKDIGGNDLQPFNIAGWELHLEPIIKFADFSKTYVPLPKFPAIVRDIAIVVDASVAWGSIETSLSHVSPLIKSMELFDVFSSHKLGENKKSFAFRMTFMSDERTLESREVDVIVAKTTKMLQDSFKAVVR